MGGGKREEGCRGGVGGCRIKVYLNNQFGVGGSRDKVHAVIGWLCGGWVNYMYNGMSQICRFDMICQGKI